VHILTMSDLISDTATDERAYERLTSDSARRLVERLTANGTLAMKCPNGDGTYRVVCFGA
jgi:hypothetical protein